MNRRTEWKMLYEILHAVMAPLKIMVLPIHLPLILELCCASVYIFLTKACVNNFVFLSMWPRLSNFLICLFESYHPGLWRQAEHISVCKSPLHFFISLFYSWNNIAYSSLNVLFGVKWCFCFLCLKSSV